MNASGKQQSTPNSQTALNTPKSCASCGGRINDRFLLHAIDRYWHTGCLKCSCCQVPLADFNSCFVKSGMILCRNDYLRLFGSGGVCGSCRQYIGAGELVMRLSNSVYHLKCFTCATCNTQLVTGDRYGIMNGSILCEQHYPKMLKEQIYSVQVPSNSGQSVQYSKTMV